MKTPNKQEISCVNKYPNATVAEYGINGIMTKQVFFFIAWYSCGLLFLFGCENRVIKPAPSVNIPKATSAVVLDNGETEEVQPETETRKPFDEKVSINQKSDIKPVVPVQEAKPIQIVDKISLQLLKPSNNERFHEGNMEISYIINAPDGSGAIIVTLKIDGVQYDTWLIQEAGMEHKHVVRLPPRNTTLSLTASNRHSSSRIAKVSLRWTGKNPHEIFKPTLYVLAVGVNEYDYDEQLRDLNYSDDDARDFAAELEKQQGKLYREVHATVLINPVRRDITKALTWLEREVTDRDVAMVLFSGHGIKDHNGRYYFLPKNADLEDLKSSAVAQSTFTDTLKVIAGKRIFFIDSCHSGQALGSKSPDRADMNKLANELSNAENGVVVFTASSGRQSSVEEPQWQNGAFTEAVLEGLRGEADMIPGGGISVDELGLYISQRVKEITGGKQTPHTVKPVMISDFPLVAP